MRYLIDGYNLMHAMGLLAGPVRPSRLQFARVRLLDDLCRWCGEGAERVSVVFDATDPPPGARPELFFRRIHVYFSQGRQADDLIEDLIEQEPTPGQLTVVSDDHRIQRAARRRHCPVLGCLDFLEGIRQPAPQAGPADEPTSAKPEVLSDEETRHWLREFSDLTDAAHDREWPGPEAFEVDPE